MRTYQWIAHDERRRGRWRLTNQEADFLDYLIERNLLREDIEVIDITPPKWWEKFLEDVD